ncbi:putative ATPase, AAA family domain-containing protein [Neospora caninum Liverpool]|uniref:Putative ATPase, AAA family domain-containing protein n=1 Tax=Neospora caninum (strain Liverpool) TaxID=572307 RepID=F0VHX3_NEOCL|nr:putative ATPase, AAA family domain-containing protein [Neospora caninum Liverpool]CBZ53334.1 putative ATPase, AAA family domain-containing protein [Neospora caninum Liverpool]|eukprot:XP_003883366.1 putative ATPase, AAA family domain-containing protein [Neospora caninum Liverpool]
MAFTRHLVAVRRQLEVYLRQRKGDEDGRGGDSSGLSPKDVDTDSFLMFLGRSHPHIVRLRRRMLDKLLETAKAELSKDQTPNSVSSRASPLSGNPSPSVSPYSQKTSAANTLSGKKAETKRTDGNLALSSAAWTAGSPAVDASDGTDSDSQASQIGSEDASFLSSEPISGVEVIHDDDSSDSDAKPAGRNLSLEEDAPAVHPATSQAALSTDSKVAGKASANRSQAPAPPVSRPNKQPREKARRGNAEGEDEEGEDGERRQAIPPGSSGPFSASAGRERIPLNTSLNSLYRSHALESQDASGRRERGTASETAPPHGGQNTRQRDKRERGREPQGTGRGHGERSSGRLSSDQPITDTAKKRKRRRSPSLRPSISSPSVPPSPSDVAPVAAPADRLRDCAGLSEALCHKIEESVLLPLVLNSLFEKAPKAGASQAARAAWERRDEAGDAPSSHATESGDCEREESAVLTEAERTRVGNDAIDKHPRGQGDRLGAHTSSVALSPPPEVFSGLHFSRGVVIHGPAGVGKTKLAFAIAGELCRLRNFSFFPISLSSLVQNLPPFLSNASTPSPNPRDASLSAAASASSAASPSVAPAVQTGPLTPASSEEVLSLMFESAKNHAPSLLLLEDIAVLSSRKGALKGKDGREGGGSGGGTGDEESDSPLVRALAREMDALTGFDVMVIATCSHIDSLDSSLRRSGRFDAEISIPLPGFEERREILQSLTCSLSLSPSVDLNALADRTVGYVAADLHSLVKETVYHAVMRSVGRRRRDREQAAAVGRSGAGRSEDDPEINMKGEQRGERDGTAERKGEATAMADCSHGDGQCRVSNGANQAEVGNEEGKNEAENISDLQHGRRENGSATPSHCLSPSFRPFPAFDEILKDVASMRQPDRALLFSGHSTLSCPASNDARAVHASPESSSFSCTTGNAISSPDLRGEDFAQALVSFTPSYKKTGAFLPRPNVRWNEVGGLHEAKQEVEERILFPLSFADFYGRMGVRKPTGILLYGPPGCGKTFLAKALANACQANFIAVKGPELLSKYVGDSEAALRRLFSRASFFSPSLIFFDEIDALCGSRSTGGKGEGGNKVEERVIAQLLTELDGINDRGKVYVVAATNRPDILDPALLRPGRLEVRVYVHLPDQQERAEILRKGWRRLRRERKEERNKRLHMSADGIQAERGPGENDELEENDLDFDAIARATDRGWARDALFTAVFVVDAGGTG